MDKKGDGMFEGGQFEDGEIKVIDDENYILSDSYFRFKFDREEPMNWRAIGSLHFDQTTGLIDNSMEPAADILMNMDQVAYTNLDKERNARWISNEGRQIEKILQCGMQYYMFVQKQMRERITVLQEYAQKQSDEHERLQSIHAKLKQKNKMYRKMNEDINDQALHYEIMINRLRPDLLNEDDTSDGSKTLAISTRPDVRLADDNPN